MRIVYASYMRPDSADVRLFLAREWMNRGHDVLLVQQEQSLARLPSLADYLSRHDPVLRAQLLERAVYNACSRFRPDVILDGSALLTVDGVHALRETFGCLVGHEMAQSTLLVRDHAALVRCCDFLIVHDSYLVPILRGTKLGRNPNVFLMGCMAEPREHRPMHLSEEDRHRYGAEIAYIGGVSDNRVEALRRLTRHDLRIWGAPAFARIPELAPYYRPEPVYGLKKSKIYSAARIVLNIEDAEKQVNAISVRVPEVLACGGFVLTEGRADLDRTPLVEGESVVSFRCLDEMTDKVDYYLGHPNERDAISRHGREVVLEHMTYRKVCAELAEQIEGVLRKQAGQERHGP